MTQYLVINTSGGANFRSAPNLAAPFVNLPFGTLVTLVAETGSKWKFVSVGGEQGYISDVNLAVPRTDAVVRLVQSAAYYWRLFSFGAGKETVKPYYDYVVKMWIDLGQGMPPKDKNGRYITNHKDWPWSAAGMSAFVRRAGGYDGFLYSRKHATYIHDSILKREANKKDAPFWGYKLSEKKPEIGDLVVQWRGTTQTYDSARKSSSFYSHTDVVCEVRDDHVWAIGANVGPDTVDRKQYSLDANGYFAGPAGWGNHDNTVFMMMSNIEV